MMTLLDVVVALRGLLEMALWLLIGRHLLALLAGASGSRNGVLRMFDFFLRPVRAVADLALARISADRRDRFSFLLLLTLWVSLGVCKRFVMPV